MSLNNYRRDMLNVQEMQGMVPFLFQKKKSKQEGQKMCQTRLACTEFFSNVTLQHVVILVALINTLGLSELVSDVLGSRKCHFTTRRYTCCVDQHARSHGARQ